MPKKPALVGLDQMLSTAALPERTVEVCLRGDLVAQVEDLERELRDLRTNTVTMADRGRARGLAEQIETLRVEMQSSVVVFRLRGLNRKAWAGLLGLHPPRNDPGTSKKDQDTDKALGYNVETFFPALIRACLVEPAMSDEQWKRLEELLTSKQYDDLIDAALAVTRRKVDVPFSFASSAMLATSGETSRQPSA